MTADRPMYGLADSREGASVRISDRAVLDEFARTWKLHHKLEAVQLDCAGQIATVQEIQMYHGGDIMYRLEGIPGLWHQRLLKAA